VSRVEFTSLVRLSGQFITGGRIVIDEKKLCYACAFFFFMNVQPEIGLITPQGYAAF
jgi:hypothetical protein